MRSSRRGPATSTVPFTGLPAAILATALATSSAAMDWMSMVPDEPVWIWPNLPAPSYKIEGDLAKLLADKADGRRYSVPSFERQCDHGLVAGNRRSDPHDRIAVFCCAHSATRISGRTHAGSAFFAFEELRDTPDPSGSGIVDLWWRRTGDLKSSKYRQYGPAPNRGVFFPAS